MFDFIHEEGLYDSLQDTNYMTEFTAHLLTHNKLGKFVLYCVQKERYGHARKLMCGLMMKLKLEKEVFMKRF